MWIFSVTSLFSLLFLFCRKASTNDDALFGIGQDQKPYPTNMRQRAAKRHIYIRPLFVLRRQGYFPFYVVLRTQGISPFLRFVSFYIFYKLLSKFQWILDCRKASADDDACVWDRAGFEALSYKRCVSELRLRNIYIRPFCRFYRQAFSPYFL